LLRLATVSSRRYNDWVAQNASLRLPAACRQRIRLRGIDSEKIVSASRRSQQASSLRYPEKSACIRAIRSSGHKTKCRTPTWGCCSGILVDVRVVHASRVGFGGLPKRSLKSANPRRLRQRPRSEPDWHFMRCPEKILNRR